MSLVGGSSMKELLTDIARRLVRNPDHVRVTERENDGTVVLELSVAPDDMGKVIGRHGKIARAIRSIMKVAASRENKKVVVDIVG
jgi:predicted RNA-binding protein YlqC (UPF0109 family)